MIRSIEVKVCETRSLLIIDLSWTPDSKLIRKWRADMSAFSPQHCYPLFGTAFLFCRNEQQYVSCLLFSFVMWCGLVYKRKVLHRPFINTRPKPPHGRQGLQGLLGKDIVKQVHFGVFSTSHFAPMALSLEWIELSSTMDVTSPTGGSNWPSLVQETWHHRQGGPTDLSWRKKRDVTDRGIQLTF